MSEYFAAEATGAPWTLQRDASPQQPPPPPPLSTDQIRHFKEHGFVILRGFIEQPVIQSWCEQFWAKMPSTRGVPSTWDRERNNAASSSLVLEPPLIRLAQMIAVAQQLGDGKLRQLGNGGKAPETIWPSPETPWQPAGAGHVDGYGNPEVDWTGGLFLNAVTYVENVNPQGGAFTYWPGSHLPVHRFFNRHPNTIDGSFANMEGWGVAAAEGRPSFYEDEPSAMIKGQGTEFIGKAGDVLLWHKFLAHSASKNNCATSPRIALICRWAHVDLYVPNRPGEKAGRTSYATHIEPLDSPRRKSELRYLVAHELDPWARWGEALQGDQQDGRVTPAGACGVDVDTNQIQLSSKL